MLPPLLLKRKTGGMSGGHAESLTAVNIHVVRVSAILKEGASKVRVGIYNERLSKEVSHSSCTLLSIWLKPW